MDRLFGGVFKSRKVLVTGHTGFKGSWLCCWLERLGAEVLGYALPPPTDPSHYRLLKLAHDSVMGDIRDQNSLAECLKRFRPEIVLHLAAQPLVRLSYREPVQTFETNVMGTVKVLEACRGCGSVKAIVVVTTDKCYENREWVWGYREDEPMGGHDPYSSSKGCAELVVSSYRRSFFGDGEEGAGTLLASARAGNVIGGGDWALDRLVPDMMKAAAVGDATPVRNPSAVRPWQHVLEPLAGYLQVAWRLMEGDRKAATAWNFGPDDSCLLTVAEVADRLGAEWPAIRWENKRVGPTPHEAMLLKLDCSKARTLLGWRPVWGAEKMLARTARWYRRYYEAEEVTSLVDLEEYVADAERLELPWSRGGR